MGGGSSHHHYHTDTESQQRAAEAQAAAAAAQEKAAAMQSAFEQQQAQNEKLFEEQRREQQKAAEEARKAQEEHNRRFEEAQRKHQADMTAAIQRHEEEYRARLQVEEKARQDAAAAARRLEQEQKQRAEEAVEAARRLEEERLACEQRVQQELDQERARVHAERLREWLALNRDYPIPDFLKAYISEVLEDVAADAAQDRYVNVGVLGNSGTGKSSLIKVIMEKFESPTTGGNIPQPLTCFEGDGTRAPAPYKLGMFNGKVHIWDVPGQGTALIPSKTYLRDMGLKYFDAVLVITDGRWSENDARLYDAIKFARIWCLVIRTKVDQAVDDAKHDHHMSQEQALKKVRETLANQVGEDDISKIQLVTTRKKYWTGGHGDLKFGTIDTLCELVANHVEHELEHGPAHATDPVDMEVDSVGAGWTHVHSTQSDQ